MKLKRIISALVVFTLVMTSAVCSVSAAATYQTITSYDVSTGEMTVNAKLAGAKEGSMVSYIIYGDADAANNAEEAVAEGNIVHIDQATVGADGTASFDAVTTDFADLNNRQVQFVSNEEDLAAWANGVKTGRAYSVETISDLQTSVLFLCASANGKGTSVSALIDGVPTAFQGTGSNISSRWVYKDEALNIPTLGAWVDLEKATAIMVDLGNRASRDSWFAARFSKYAGSYNGANQKADDGEWVYATSKTNDEVTQVKGGVVGEGQVNMLVDGLYKDDITDNEFAGLELFGGDIIGVNHITDPVGANTATSVNYATVYNPIIGKYEDSEPEGVVERDSVTFLCTMTAAAYAEGEVGLNIYRYEKVANSKDAELELIASCPSAAESGNFAIQLFDGSGEGELNPEKYDFVAYPYVTIDGVKVELTVFGDTYVTNPDGDAEVISSTDDKGKVTYTQGRYGSCYFYTRNHDATTAEDNADAE